MNTNIQSKLNNNSFTVPTILSTERYTVDGTLITEELLQNSDSAYTIYDDYLVFTKGDLNGKVYYPTELEGTESKFNAPASKWEQIAVRYGVPMLQFPKIENGIAVNFWDWVDEHNLPIQKVDCPYEALRLLSDKTIAVFVYPYTSRPREKPWKKQQREVASWDDSKVSKSFSIKAVSARAETLNTYQTRDELFKHIEVHATANHLKSVRDVLNYRMPPNYITQRSLVGLAICSSITVATEEDKNDKQPITADHFFCSWFNKRSPLYCISSLLTEALTKTDILQKKEFLRTAIFPYTEAIFCIPIDMIKSPTKGVIDYLGIACLLDGESRKICIYTVDTLKTVWTGIIEVQPTGNILQDDGSLNEEEIKFTNKLLTLAINILLLLESSGDSLITDVLLSETLQEYQKPKGFGKKTNIFPPKYPRWIGKNYKIKSERSPNTESGTHVSPRTHWRRGHWRCIEPGEGKQWKESKRLWIEPVLINAGID